jgi:hypothetical protein
MNWEDETPMEGDFTIEIRIHDSVKAIIEEVIKAAHIKRWGKRIEIALHYDMENDLVNKKQFTRINSGVWKTSRYGYEVFIYFWRFKPVVLSQDVNITIR